MCLSILRARLQHFASKLRLVEDFPPTWGSCVEYHNGVFGRYGISVWLLYITAAYDEEFTMGPGDRFVYYSDIRWVVGVSKSYV